MLFDLFGTLVDNFNQDEHESVLAEMASVINIPQEEFQRVWRDTFMDQITGVHPSPHHSIRYICQQVNTTVDDATIEEAVRISLDYTLHSVKPRSDTIVTLKKLQSLRLKTGLISDCTGDIPMVWEQSPFTGIFNATVFSCEVLSKKPDPEMYNIATRRLGVRPQECIFVGDGGSGELTGAKKLGMLPILIRDPGEGEYHFMEREDDWNGLRISYLREVLNLVK